MQSKGECKINSASNTMTLHFSPQRMSVECVCAQADCMDKVCRMEVMVHLWPDFFPFFIEKIMQCGLIFIIAGSEKKKTKLLVSQLIGWSWTCLYVCVLKGFMTEWSAGKLVLFSLTKFWLLWSLHYKAHWNCGKYLHLQIPIFCTDV